MQDTANGFEKMLVISHQRSMACGCENRMTGMWQFEDFARAMVKRWHFFCQTPERESLKTAKTWIPAFAGTTRF